MVLHTIIDAYDIFYKADSAITPEISSEVVALQSGAYVEGGRSDSGFRMNRIISTNLRDYLTYQPGAVIDDSIVRRK